MDASEQILRELRWIKWLNVLICLSFAAIGGTFVWATHEMSSSFARADDASSFSDRASKLLEEGKETELLAACEEREKKSPKDPNVHWYRGKAYYQLGQFTESLKAIQRVHELAPNWRQDHTTPYIKAIEEKLAQKR